MNNENGEYYRRSAAALKLVRYIVLLIFIFFLLCCIFVFRDDITVENIQYLVKYFDFYSPSDAAGEAEISISADSESQIFMLRDNLSVVSRSGIGLYEFSGRKIFNYSYSYSNPGVIHDDRNILVYDITGNEISIFNSFSRVYSQKYPYSVKAACINENGFAVVTNEKTYRSGVIVYNKDYEEIYRRMSADRYVTAVDLSIDGSRLVCSDVLSENGSYNSLITVTDMRSGETLYQTSVSDELVLRTGFSDDGKSIYAITDSMLHFYSSELESVTDFKYNQSKTEKFFIENGVIVLTESNNLSGNSMTLIGFDFAGNQLFRENADSKITSVAVGKNELYALSSKYLYSYGFDGNKSLTLRKKIATDGRFSTVLADSTGRCITASTKKAVRGILDSDNSDSGENGDENTNSSEKKVRNENFDNR